MKRIVSIIIIIFTTSSIFGNSNQIEKERLKDGLNGNLPWGIYKQSFSQDFNQTRPFDREIIWENWYDPFGADGYNVRPHMALCQDGGYAITGYYVIEDGMGGYMEWCGYVLKTDSVGNFLWADKDTLSFPTAPTHESNCIIETSNGGLINAGDGYMIKRDTDGERLWTQDLDIAPTTVCHSFDSNIVISGGMPEGYCLFRIIDENGDEILNNDFILGTNYTVAKRIIPTSDGGYAITGVVSDEIANTDIFVCKTNAIGDTLWTYRKDGCGDSDVGRWITENSNNELLVVGDIYPEPLAIRGYIAKLSLDGELLYEEILDPDNGYNCWYAIDIPEENSFMITAVPYILKCDYDLNIEWIENEGLLPYYKKVDLGYLFYSNGVHLMRTDNNIVSVTSDLLQRTNEFLKIYPNPFNPFDTEHGINTTISFNQIPMDVKGLEVEIYNIRGQKIKTIPISSVKCSTRSVTWNGMDKNNQTVTSGVYLTIIRNKNRVYATKKITLIK